MKKLDLSLPNYFYYYCLLELIIHLQVDPKKINNNPLVSFHDHKNIILNINQVIE